MDYQVQVAHRVEEIGQSAWDQLSDDRPFTSYRWYRYGETILPDLPPTYLIVSSHDQPLARATFWLTRQEFLPIPSRPIRSMIAALLRRWPLFICRVPLTSSSGLIVPADLPGRDSILTAIARTARELMRPYRASFGFFDYLEQHEMDWSGWPETFRTTAFSKPGTRLEITWSDFESYLRQLPKSVQKDYRRHRNRAADLGIVVTYDQAPPPEQAALTLIRSVERQHHSQSNPLNEVLLRTGAMVDSVWLKATIDDRLVGCGMLVGEGKARFLALLGLDYGVEYVYFQLFYSAIRYAIEQGLQILRGGGGAYEIKQRLGFQLESNHYARYTANGRLLDWLARRIG